MHTSFYPLHLHSLWFLTVFILFNVHLPLGGSLLMHSGLTKMLRMLKMHLTFHILEPVSLSKKQTETEDLNVAPERKNTCNYISWVTGKWKTNRKQPKPQSHERVRNKIIFCLMMKTFCPRRWLKVFRCQRRGRAAWRRTCLHLINQGSLPAVCGGSEGMHIKGYK